MSLFVYFFLVYKIKEMFFYLLYKSTILDSSNSILKNENRSIKVLLYGSVIYVILHMSLFLGGKEALLYNFKLYFWVLLGLDISILLLTNVMNRDGSINFLFTEKVNNSNYRVNIDNKPMSEVNEINDSDAINKRYVPDNLETVNYNPIIGKKQKKNKKDKKREKSVSFNLKKDDTNKYSQVISKDLYKKSTPLNQLPNYSSENNNMVNLNNNYSSSSSSESESEFNTDIDFNSFERSLSI